MDITETLEETAEALGVTDALQTLAEAVQPQPQAPDEPQVPQEEQPKAPKPKRIIKGTRKVKGKVKSQPKTIEEWIEARIKDPKTFRLTSEGNALAPAIGSGNRELILDIPKRSLASAEQIDAYYAERDVSIKDAKSGYAEARRALYNVYKQYKAGLASVSDYLLVNKQVIEAEQLLIASGVKERNVKDVDPDPMLRDLYPESKNSDKKSTYTIYQLQRTTLPWSVLLVDAPSEVALDEEPPAQAEPEQQAQPQQTDEERERARVGAIIGTRRRLKK